MATKLENLEVSMISLVKSGANKKSIIYKSAKEPNLSKDIKIIKSDEEGVVYGIVYSPNEIDSQGDFADANTIKTAAYSFMKSGFAKNVDREHSFNNVDAYVCQSWLIKSGDPVFPDEKEGSWAVAIKLESDELKDAVKKGEISGISMAGVANKIQAQETSKSENSLTNLIKSIESVFKQKREEKVEQDVLKAIQSGLDSYKQSIDALSLKLESLEKRVKLSEEALSKSAQKTDIKIDENQGVL
ncbi:XkdF-like putative serine protease domain-containing protein [Campylobacter sp. CLAX-22107-21]|uniref:XkdF-like putative serine protease domain-containing protein n=1 Tax=Campylobacter devanensis TaxID=3161138 RepID=UPI002EC4D403|nr:XkdF-like putative serine protease domain-containing protein [Campylobacter sp. CLAX-22107-21]